MSYFGPIGFLRGSCKYFGERMVYFSSNGWPRVSWKPGSRMKRNGSAASFPMLVANVSAKSKADNSCICLQERLTWTLKFKVGLE